VVPSEKTWVNPSHCVPQDRFMVIQSSAKPAPGAGPSPAAATTSVPVSVRKWIGSGRPGASGRSGPIGSARLNTAPRRAQPVASSTLAGVTQFQVPTSSASPHRPAFDSRSPSRRSQARSQGPRPGVSGPVRPAPSGIASAAEERGDRVVPERADGGPGVLAGQRDPLVVPLQLELGGERAVERGPQGPDVGPDTEGGLGRQLLGQ